MIKNHMKKQEKESDIELKIFSISSITTILIIGALEYNYLFFLMLWIAFGGYFFIKNRKLKKSKSK